ncbi:MAG: hypothetical protein GY817_01340 [bacterium]|nr:hypothetical protein [bacterium]
MSKIALALKINLSQIDMARAFQGKKGQYLDATIFVEMDELDQYGNSGMITQDVSKEEKQQGVKGNILGNGKVFWVENGQAPQQAGAQQQGGFQQQAPQQGGFQQQPAPQQGFQQQQQGQYQQQQPANQGFQQQPQQQQQQPTFDDDIAF